MPMNRFQFGLLGIVPSLERSPTTRTRMVVLPTTAINKTLQPPTSTPRSTAVEDKATSQSARAYLHLDTIRDRGSISAVSLHANNTVHRTNTTSKMPVLSSYLSEQKARFLGDDGEGWTVVMGNEAGDLDSLASAIGYAWLLSSNTKTIALVPTPREDFVLRAENLYALQLVGLTDGLDELLCPEDLPRPDICKTFALVDHNSLHPTYASPEARVTAVVDHHEDEGKYLATASPRIVEPAGSCASLVTRIVMSYPTLEIPPEIATLLLSAIVIDTHGLKKDGKAVNVDHEASAWLLPRASVPPSDNLVAHAAESLEHVRDDQWIRSLTKTLGAKKTAVSHLSTRDLLRRDYKEYHLNLSSAISGETPCSIKAGLATVPLSLKTFFSASPAAAVVATKAWIKERGLSILGVLTTYRNKHDKARREVLWVVDEGVVGSKLAEVLFEGFEESEVLEVKQTNFGRYGFDGQAEAPFGVGLATRVYKQKNLAATRKQVAPILKRVLE